MYHHLFCCCKCILCFQLSFLFLLLHVTSPVILNLYTTMSPSSNCPLFQALQLLVALRRPTEQLAGTKEVATNGTLAVGLSGH